MRVHHAGHDGQAATVDHLALGARAAASEPTAVIRPSVDDHVDTLELAVADIDEATFEDHARITPSVLGPGAGAGTYNPEYANVDPCIRPIVDIRLRTSHQRIENRERWMSETRDGRRA